MATLSSLLTSIGTSDTFIDKTLVRPILSPTSPYSFNGVTGEVGLSDGEVRYYDGSVHQTVVTTALSQTINNKTLVTPTISAGYIEDVVGISGTTTPALTPSIGSIQTWTLSGNSTPTAGTWYDGQSMTLMIDDGTNYTITWTSLSVTWKTDAGSAPTLNTSGYTVIALWKVGGTIYGARVGDA